MKTEDQAPSVGTKRRKGLPAAVAVVCLALVAYFVFLFDPSAWEWWKAHRQNTIEAYTQFIQEYPKSDHAAEAAKALKALEESRDWKALSARATLDSLSAFVKAYPESAHRAEAVGKLKHELLLAAVQKYADRHKAKYDAKGAEDLASMAALGEKDKPGNPADYQKAIDLLVYMISHDKAEPLRVSLGGIKPKEEKPGPEVDASMMGTGVTLSGFITSASGEKLILKGVIASSDGSLNNSVCLAKGSGTIGDPAKSRRNFAAKIAISKKTGAKGSYVVHAELPEEWVCCTMSFGYPGGSFELLVPDARGTVVRFLGDVPDFYPGYRFTSDAGSPLCFVLLDKGLTYVCGKGTVTSKDGGKWTFPAPAREPGAGGRKAKGA
jgi:hypothetical protein